MAPAHPIGRSNADKDGAPYADGRPYATINHQREFLGERRFPGREGAKATRSVFTKEGGDGEGGDGGQMGGAKPEGKARLTEDGTEA